MYSRWLVVAMAASGCVPVPPDRSEQVLLEVNRVTGEVASTSSAPMPYRVRFADQGVRGPQSIIVQGVDALRAGSCPFEGGVGITVFPALIASAPLLGGASGATGTLTVDWAGPVVARVVVTWRVPYTCGDAQEARGTSTFTLFPNGRIVRHDVATPSTTTLTVSGGACGCATDDKFIFSSFWNFEPAVATVLPDGTPWVDGTSSFGCAVYPTHTIGVGLPEPSRARLFPDMGSSAFVHDWERDATTLAPTEQQATSAILLSKETSAARCGQVTAGLADPAIAIGSGAAVLSDTSGIYRRTGRQTARFQISAPTAIPPGFAVSVDVGDHAVVERSPPRDGAWYAAQADGSQTILWFRDGLAVGETIAIEPR